ncbi:conjugal transfer protein TraT [Neiella marina]|uniref:Conjugal transfer protein TraT n=1 Tax=Neiella marina TaxID=508461 RepID=A0A8J2U5P9_9GAMM|nr:complement resistance protein TraT [Neiella marina]GGA79497.1 conjugal transfer protein TraT [Neiella marina]
MTSSTLKKTIIAFSALAMLALGGCSATHTAIKKRNLDVQTKMSDTVFLDPVPPEQMVVYLQIRNTSDKQDLNVRSAIENRVVQRGYRITKNPNEAHYMVQANILQVGKVDKREAEGMLQSGYGAGLTGAVIGAGGFGSGKGSLATGLIGAAIGVAADAMVEDVYYTMVTDLQLSERAEEGVVVTENNSASLKQGNSGAKSVSSSKKTQWHRYQTRIVSTANKVNLEFPEALPSLEKGLIDSISGIL